MLTKQCTPTTRYRTYSNQQDCPTMSPWLSKIYWSLDKKDLWTLESTTPGYTALKMFNVPFSNSISSPESPLVTPLCTVYLLNPFISLAPALFPILVCFCIILLTCSCSQIAQASRPPTAPSPITSLSLSTLYLCFLSVYLWWYYHGPPNSRCCSLTFSSLYSKLKTKN